MNGLAALCFGVTLAGGLWPFAGGDRAADESATIATLEDAKPRVQVEAPSVDSAAQAMEQYRRFLALGTGPESMRAEALRRLADLNLEAGVRAESDAEQAGAGAPRFEEAVALYSELLKIPGNAGDGTILYQLARALEGAGRGDEALTALDNLVVAHPQARHLDEAEFRRGETYFVRKQYIDAEQAYAAVLARGDSSTFYEQSLYKHGWSLFKQGRYEEALVSFLAVLDRRLAAAGDRPSAAIEKLGRAERELLDDTLRVTSISYSYLEGAGSITPSLAARGQPAWGYLLYQALGDLYLDKERFRDAAETYERFVSEHPVDLQAPRLQQAAIEAYTRGRFPSLVLDAKRKYVETYGLDAAFWTGRERSEQETVVAQLKTHLGDLASHDHAEAQKSGSPADYERAAGWYRRFLAYFPDDPASADRSFLLGELLFESHHFDEARDAYLQSAYQYGAHEKAATAAYAALLASREHEKQLEGDARTAWHEEHVEHALRFASSFPAHAEAGSVLATVAEELFAAGKLERAIEVAGLVVTLQPPARPEFERVAWTVRAHAQFDLGRFAEAENSYVRLRGYELPPEQKKAVEERVAASIYRQAEAAQGAGDVDSAVANFLRIAAAAPGSEIRPNALFDASTLLLSNERWPQAVDLLLQFRAEFPEHRFNPDVTVKLATALKSSGRNGEAALEYERIAGQGEGGDDVKRAALWQAAELYGAAGQAVNEARVYDTFVGRYPAPLGEAQEARLRLADLSAADWSARQRWLREIVSADARAGAARTDRSRFLAASSAIELARPSRDAFMSIAITMPLDQSLKLKKTRMEEALRAYGAAAGYGVAEVTTAATFETAELYYQLSRDLLNSERPAGLDADELEQYELLLEEQAFPFEEQAIDIYRANLERAADGVYDEWVRASIARLAVISPARYARTERSAHVATWID